MTFNLGITLIFILFLILWIQIPGMLFEAILLPRRLSFSIRFLAAFFIGFIYSATVYFIESITGVAGLLMLAGPIASAVAVAVYLKKKRPSFYNAGEKFSWTGIIIFVLILLASFLNFQFKYMGALSGQTTQVYHDYLFHTGNIVSLSRSFPNGDIRIDGLTFYYHYYYELIFAMCKHIFKVDAFSLYLNGNSFVCAWPLTLAFLCIGERLRAGKVCHKLNYFFYCGGLLVSCICIMPLNVVGIKLPFSWLDNHLFSNANAMGLALSLSVVVIDILAELWYDKYSPRVMIALYLLAAAATGFKGTTGILLVAISWIVLITEAAIMKNFHIGRLLYVASITLGFVLTYVIVTVGLNPSGSNNRAMAISPEGTISAGRVGQIISKLGFDYNAFPWVIIAVILCAIAVVGPCILAFGAFTVARFKTLIKNGILGDIFDWFVIGSVLMGIGGACFVTVPGNSQIYFVITNAGFIFYGAMKYIIENRKKLIAYITYLFFGIGTAFLIIDLAYYGYSAVKQEAVYEAEAGQRADLVSAETMEAYLWLRDNTDENAKVAVDRLSEEIDYRSIYFYCSAFSERQCYLEGYDYSDVTEKQINAMLSINEKFYSSNAREAEMAMDMNGIDYLVVTKLGHPDYKCTSMKLKLVFENEDVKIYQYNSKDGMAAIK